MPIRPEVLQTILLLGIATYACRAGGFFLMRYVAITPRVEAWLRSIPIALIGALLGPIAVTGGPPEWLGTVHTHSAHVAGQPYSTFSGSDRGVMTLWQSTWEAPGVFCILYDERRTHCEAGDEGSGEAFYGYERGNNLAQ